MLLLSVLVQTEHCDEYLQSEQSFAKIADGRLAEVLPTALTTNFFKIVKVCLLKHSRRPTSSEVLVLFFKLVVTSSIVICRCWPCGVLEIVILSGSSLLSLRSLYHNVITVCEVLDCILQLLCKVIHQF